MTIRKTILFLVWALILTVPLSAQEAGRAQMILRHDKGYSAHSLEENAAYLVDQAGPGGRIAIRVCSNEPLLVSVLISASSPFYLSSWLKTVYGYRQDQIVYLRSTECPGSDKELAATELWAVPSGADLPQNVESIKASQLSWDVLGNESGETDGPRDYRPGVAELLKKLRKNPQSEGVVLGFYYKKPSLGVKKRLKKIEMLLQRSGLPRDRYTVRILRWGGDREIPTPPEPKYPTIFFTEIVPDDAKPVVERDQN